MIQFKQPKYSMEGEISKHHSTESVSSTSSHIGFSSDCLLDISQNISDCLNASNALLGNYLEHQSQLKQYRQQIEDLRASNKTRKLKYGFQKSDGNGLIHQEGHFMKRQYCPIILKHNN